MTAKLKSRLCLLLSLLTAGTALFYLLSDKPVFAPPFVVASGLLWLTARRLKTKE